MKKPDAVIAGDGIYAGIDSDDATEINKHSILICFDSHEQFREAIKTGSVEFTVFGTEPPNGVITDSKTLTTQLYARIKRNNHYANQNDHPSFGSHFPVTIGESDHEWDEEQYIVKGGVGGQYKLKDVNIFIKNPHNGKMTKISK